MKKIASGTYQKDKFYKPVKQAVVELMYDGEIISPVNMLMRMGRLDKLKLEDWRMGRVPYLERVISGNLAHLNRILRILRCHAKALQLTPLNDSLLQMG